ncbi:MAG: aminotransferase class I/II-fold pyridoxal phosphate-dependent enzyme [Flavobacteriales bacterium]|nr:aminotransferase class I/II-fold pyridoxal phosphate-dependent enzyme [Flavobacteriales bacterium]
MIDLRSDTVTKPSPGMLQAMINAETGDDVFREDPTVKELEDDMAGRFGMDAGLFCTSGTMANQVAIKAHTVPGDEIICDEFSHIYNYEGGAPALVSGVSIRAVHGRNGILLPEDIIANIKTTTDWHTITRMVVIENSCNMTGGNYYPLDQVQALSEACRKNGLIFHVDGARIFNALTASGDASGEYGKHTDSISICLSKGLGCPIGSVLVGNKEFIEKARRIRKTLGGGMRQVGILAAAGKYALEHNIPLLKDDHRRAKQLAEKLNSLSYVDHVSDAFTNILIFRLEEHVDAQQFLDHLKARNILAFSVRPQTIRFVLHLDVNDEMTDTVCQALEDF